MQNLTSLIENSDNTKILKKNDVFMSLHDLKEQNPQFYQYLLNKVVEIKEEESLPFIIKEGEDAGLLLDGQTGISIEDGEEAIKQLYGGRDGLHQEEIKRDYQPVIDNPNTFVMLSTNGCQLTPGQFDKLRTIQGIKKIGYGLPMEPKALINDIKGVEGLYLIQNESFDIEEAATTSISTEKKLSALLMFEKRKRTKIKDLLVSKHGLTYGASVILEGIFNKSRILKGALQDYRTAMLVLIHDRFISFLKEKKNLHKYMTREEIEKWELYDMDFLLTLAEDRPVWNPKYTRLESILDKCIFDEPLAINRGPSLQSTYAYLLTFYRELQNPSWECPPDKINSFTFLIYYLYDIEYLKKKLVEFLGEPNEIKVETVSGKTEAEIAELNTISINLGINVTYIDEKQVEGDNKNSVIRSAQEDFFQKLVENYIRKIDEAIAKFNEAIGPEIASLVGARDISPLYPHYQAYCKLNQKEDLSFESSLEGINKSSKEENAAAQHPLDLNAVSDREAGNAAIDLNRAENALLPNQQNRENAPVQLPPFFNLGGNFHGPGGFEGR